MPKRRYRVLAVTPSPDVSRIVVGSLSSAGYDVALATDFTSAKDALDSTPPDLLISEIRLGAYNGLHLAIRARAQSTRAPGARTHAIVIGPRDNVLEDEARQQHVLYLTPPLDPSTLPAIVSRLLQDSDRACSC
jgi:DNA-binding response OmpR family regulator